MFGVGVRQDLVKFAVFAGFSCFEVVLIFCCLFGFDIGFCLLSSGA